MKYTIEQIWLAMLKVHDQQKGAFDDFDGVTLVDSPIGEHSPESMASRVRRHFGVCVVEQLISDECDREAKEMGKIEHAMIDFTSWEKKT